MFYWINFSKKDPIVPASLYGSVEDDRGKEEAVVSD